MGKVHLNEGNVVNVDGSAACYVCRLELFVAECNLLGEIRLNFGYVINRYLAVAVDVTEGYLAGII